MPPDEKHGRQKDSGGSKNLRILSMLDKYRQKAAHLPLPQLLETYQTSFGLHTTAIHEEILRRRSDGTLEKSRGVPVSLDAHQIPPTKVKVLGPITEFCKASKFVRADNAVGGGIAIRKVTSSISVEAILLRLREDVRTLPAGVSVYYRIEDDNQGCGVVLHYDYDDFVVVFKRDVVKEE